MKDNIGNYAKHAAYWDWSKQDHDRTPDDEYWYQYAKRYGNNVLIPMCALGEAGAYMARRGMNVTAFDITPEMIAEGRKRFGDVPGLRLFEGDVTDFRFDIPPADFCYSVDFGHILTIEDVKRALARINYHLRDSGGLVIETTLPPTESHSYPLQTFMPSHQVYPGLKVWKTGEGRFDAETGQHYISQRFYAEDESGHTESFDHAFYLQSYSREQWLAALEECGFGIVGEYRNREVESWQSGGDGFWIVEAVKTDRAKALYAPAVSIDHLQTGMFRHGDVSLYNDCISLEFPNSGYIPSFQFGIFAEGRHVGSISVKIGYAIRYHYSGQIGYEIWEAFRGRGYATKACFALIPFLRQYGFQRVLITTDEGNAASRRVCDKIGARLIETVDTPTWTNLYKQGQRRTCRFEWVIESQKEGEPDGT